jgi:hypothetical protein
LRQKRGRNLWNNLIGSLKEDAIIFVFYKLCSTEHAVTTHINNKGDDPPALVAMSY